MPVPGARPGAGAVVIGCLACLGHGRSAALPLDVDALEAEAAVPALGVAVPWVDGYIEQVADDVVHPHGVRADGVEGGDGVVAGENARRVGVVTGDVPVGSASMVSGDNAVALGLHT